MAAADTDHPADGVGEQNLVLSLGVDFQRRRAADIGQGARFVGFYCLKIWTFKINNVSVNELATKCLQEPRVWNGGNNNLPLWRFEVRPRNARLCSCEPPPPQPSLCGSTRWRTGGCAGKTVKGKKKKQKSGPFNPSFLEELEETNSFLQQSAKITSRRLKLETEPRTMVKS